VDNTISLDPVAVTNFGVSLAAAAADVDGQADGLPDIDLEDPGSAVGLGQVLHIVENTAKLCTGAADLAAALHFAVAVCATQEEDAVRRLDSLYDFVAPKIPEEFDVPIQFLPAD
jgi:hypothetical protein